MNFISEVKLSYLEFPLMLCFNSDLEDENVFLSMSAGLQFDYLMRGEMIVDPYPVIIPGNEIDMMKLFKRTNVRLDAEAGFNFLVSDNWIATAGFRFSRTLNDIENKNFTFDKTKDAAEYYFPVSTKKEVKTAPANIAQRYSTNLITYGVFVGAAYWFGKK
jgi:hypothetical protein